MPTNARRISRWSGLAVTAVGIVVLVGWLTGEELLVSVLPQSASAKANTALMLVFAGLSLALRPSRVRTAFEFAVVLIATASLAEWLLDVDLGIDELIAADHTRGVFPGRPAPATAAALLSFGLARLTAGRRGERPILSGVFTIASLSCIFAIELGYLYNDHELIARDMGTGVAIPTALALAVLAVGLAATTADHPPLAWWGTRGTVGKLSRRLLPTTVFAPPLIGMVAQIGHLLGLYDVETRLVLSITVLSVVLTAMTVVVLVVVARSEEARERLSRELAATFEHLPASMTLRDPNGVFLRANRTFAEHTHFDAETIVGKPMEAIYPPDILPWAQAEIAELTTTGKPTHSEYTADLGDGPRTFDVTRYPVLGAGGEMIGLGTFSLDITDRKRAEASAAAAASRVEAFLESAPDATVVVDQFGVVRYANRQVTALLGYPLDELIGHSVDMLVPDHTRDGHSMLRGRFMQNPSMRPMGGRNLTARHRDGHEVPVLISLGPTQTDQGMWTMAAIRDVTALRAAEKALEAAEARYRSDLDVAGIVQRQLLLAPTPSIAGYDVAASFAPASLVSGDFYDLWLLDGELRIVVADVMGKGVGAAIIGSGVRSLLHSALTFHPPQVGVSRVALDLVSDFSHTSRFVTCFAACLDTKTGCLTWVDAGHGLALVLRPNGSADWLRGTDLPIGAMPGGTWTAHETTLEVGDMLLVASDGLLDHVDGAEHIPALIRRHDTSDARGLVNELKQNYPPVSDDITMAVVRRVS
ncbi:MAG: SpoIIE family protein phosphatase [Nocardiaceae bacterium]|nr:SpoIIE family protein phosphatase [Nocardiaceae bacterium]